jgi:hypothetical protein
METQDMTHPSEPATFAASEASVTVLRAALRRQSRLLGAAIAAGGVTGAAGLALGSITLWQGWTLGAWNFAARGTGIVIVSGLVLLAVRGLLPVRSSSRAGSVQELVDLGLERTVRAIRAVRLGLAACVVAGAFGLAGAAIRYAAGNPPAVSPVVDLAVLLVGACAMLLVGFGVYGSLARFARLRRIIRRG